MSHYRKAGLLVATAAFAIFGAAPSASARHALGVLRIYVPYPVYAPIVADFDPRVAYAPCQSRVGRCVYIVHSLQRAACAVGATSGRGYSSRQYVAHLKWALAQGCGGEPARGNLVSARY